MIAAWVWTGVRFSNLKNSRTGSGPGFKKFGTGAESESEKVTPANSGTHAQSNILHTKYADKTYY